MKVTSMTLGPLETNCYVVTDEQTGGCVVIDPASRGKHIAQTLQEDGLHLLAILLTHAHFDHIGGLKTLQAETNAPIYISLADSTDPAQMSDGFLTFTDLVKDGDVLTFDGLQFTVLETPGHTPGSVCYLCGNELFSGDTLFAGSCGRTDFKGGDAGQMMQSLKKLSGLSGQLRVLPGHGESSTIADEQMSNPYMKEAMRR